MGLTMITALEIFTNPGDLEIGIGQEKNGARRYCFGIYRGPGHNCKALLTSEPFAETKEIVIVEVGKILGIIHDVAMKELKNPESLISQFLNPDGQEVEPSRVLNSDLISRILEELRAKGCASTCEMLTPAG